MSMFVTMLLVILFVAAGAVVVLNLVHRSDSVSDFWSLDNEYERKSGKLDFLRTKAAFYTAIVTVVLIGLLDIFVLK
ncbi:hypothetical protein WT56_20495 [Burkholderia pseudomultivorans]|uniref:Protein-export membrane protein SecG n=2 Tax=Burkholderia pseudomultivorans TaxID=1207504 RepID=A0A132EEI7_9BURK|nr:hypothetical protein WT56_20495 [Burkholderia pseudomultivorans]